MTTPLDTFKDAVLGVPFDPSKEPSKSGTVKAFAEMQVQLEASQSGAIVKSTLSSLNALVSVSQASQMAWVTNDPVQLNNGIYENTGTAIAPSWARRTDIPQFVVTGTLVIGSTQNNILIETDLPVPVENGRCLVMFPITETNTENVTVSINSNTPLQVLTNSGNQIPAGGFTTGMIVSGFISSTGFRLLSDIASTAIQNAAEVFANIAQSTTPYENRNEALNVPLAVVRLSYIGPNNSLLAFKHDPLGTALTTADNRTWSPDGISTPEHYGDVINTAMPLWASDLSGREGALDAGRTYAITSKLAFPRRNFTLHANGAELDYSARANADGDVAGSLLSVSGVPFAYVDIASIISTTDIFGQITTTVTTTGPHGQIVGDECMLSSDDVIDIGHHPINETRGQFVRVETVISATQFTTNQTIYDALVTNPVLMLIDWAENIHIKGALRIKGPGRRATAAGFLGLSFTFARDCTIDGLSTDGVDYQAFVRDNCLRVNAGFMTFKFGVKGSSEAVQYGDTLKNASTNCHTAFILGYGGKHLFDWTRNTTPGIGRHCTIGPIVGYDTWDAMAATHGNSRDLTFTTMTGYNCKYVFGNRVAGVRVQDIYGENCSEVLKLTDDARDMSVDTVRGKNVTYVVRAKDPTWIGTTESRNIKIGRVEGEGVSGTTLSLDWSDVPVFTQLNAAVTGGSSNTITMGDFSVTMYNNSGALTGSEITMDRDGGGSGTAQTRQITGHNYSGGVNTITVSSWTIAPLSGTSTYVIRSFVDDVNIGKVISKNCVGADVFVAGNLRRLVVGDMDVVSESVDASPAVLVQGTANTHPDTIRFGKLRNFQKSVAAVSGFATDVTFDIDAAVDTVLKTGSTMTGPLTLSAAPTATLGAATKGYVDNRTVPSARQFGAILNGIADDTAAFEALAATGAGVLDLGDGVAKISRQITFAPDTVLRFGDLTMDASDVVSAASFPNNSVVFCQGDARIDLPDLSVSPIKGARTLTFASAPSVVRGDWIEISDSTDGSFNAVRTYYRNGLRGEVQSVAGSVVTLWEPMVVGFDHTTVDVRKFPKSTLKMQGARLHIIGSTALNYGFFGRLLLDPDLTGLEGVDAKVAGITMQECQRVRGDRILTRHDDPAGGSSIYGMSIVCCQDVRMSGDWTGLRHGITVTGGPEEVSIPNRWCYFSGRVSQPDIANTSVGAFNLHGNSEFCGFDGDMIGGVNFSGDFSRFRGTIYAYGPEEGSLLAQELLGFNHDFTGVTIINGPNVNPNTATRAVITISSGSSNDLTANTTRGGVLKLDGISIYCPDAEVVLRWRNWGCVQTMKISMRGTRVMACSGSRMGRFQVETGSNLALLDMEGLEYPNSLDFFGGAVIDKVRGWKATGKLDMAVTGAVSVVANEVTFSQSPPKPPVVIVANADGVGGGGDAFVVGARDIGATKFDAMVTTANGTNFDAARTIPVNWIASLDEA